MEAIAREREERRLEAERYRLEQAEIEIRKKAEKKL